jgi:hypothetical protein
LDALEIASRFMNSEYVLSLLRVVQAAAKYDLAPPKSLIITERSDLVNETTWIGLRAP